MTCVSTRRPRVPSELFAPDAKARGSEARDLGMLPEWNLSDLYAAPDAPEVARDLERAGEDARRIRDTYQGKLVAIG